MQRLYEQQNQYSATQRQFGSIEREITQSQAKIASLQGKLNDEATRINMQLNQIQQNIHQLRHTYQVEQEKIARNGQHTSKIHSIATSIHNNMLKYSELSKGTERYYNLRDQLQQENTRYNNLLNKHRLMQSQYN